MKVNCVILELEPWVCSSLLCWKSVLQTDFIVYGKMAANEDMRWNSFAWIQDVFLSLGISFYDFMNFSVFFGFFFWKVWKLSDIFSYSMLWCVEVTHRSQNVRRHWATVFQQDWNGNNIPFKINSRMVLNFGIKHTNISTKRKSEIINNIDWLFFFFIYIWCKFRGNILSTQLLPSLSKGGTLQSGAIPSHLVTQTVMSHTCEYKHSNCLRWWVKSSW